MAEPKTRKTTASVKGFIAKIDDPARRRDAQVVCEMMERLSGDVPAMWGPTIIGFGSHGVVGANWKSPIVTLPKVNAASTPMFMASALP